MNTESTFALYAGEEEPYLSHGSKERQSQVHTQAEEMAPLIAAQPLRKWASNDEDNGRNMTTVTAESRALYPRARLNLTINLQGKHAWFLKYLPI